MLKYHNRRAVWWNTVPRAKCSDSDLHSFLSSHDQHSAAEPSHCNIHVGCVHAQKRPLPVLVIYAIVSRHTNLLVCSRNVFEKINKNSMKLWLFGMYLLLEEYNSKPMLPPPFIVFEHIFRFCRLIYKKKKQSKGSHPPLLLFDFPNLLWRF